MKKFVLINHESIYANQNGYALHPFKKHWKSIGPLSKFFDCLEFFLNESCNAVVPVRFRHSARFRLSTDRN
ncbi:hypothetical protein QQG55_53210 [Brugia pahangi]